MGSVTIPESLKPLLEEESDTSWNSAFVTPRAYNMTCSSLSSADRKVLMPSNSSKNVSYKITSDVIRIVKHLYNK
jgi:hypothetical protein